MKCSNSENWRICKECGDSKPPADYSRRANICTVCRDRNKAMVVQRWRGKRHSRRWRDLGAKADERAAARAKLFGVPVEAIKELETASRGVCMVCGCAESGKRHAVDHCHTTNVLRGILCIRCNTALGMMRDSPNLLRRLAEYIERRAGGFIFSSGKTVSCKIKLTNTDSVDASNTQEQA